MDYLHFTRVNGFPKLNAIKLIDLKYKYRLQFFKWTFLPVDLERGTKTLQIDVCCEAIDQIFDCGCVLKKCYANLHILTSLNKEITIQKNWNYWLKNQQLKICVLPRLPSFYLKTLLSKVNATYHFHIKSG